MDAMEFRARNRTLYRSVSESNVKFENVVMLTTEASRSTHSGPPTPLNCLVKSVIHEGDSETADQTNLSQSDTASLDINSSLRNSNRLNMDGVPSTPELCALQAILPKQVHRH